MRVIVITKTLGWMSIYVIMWNIVIWHEMWYYHMFSLDQHDELLALTHWGRVTQICVSKFTIIGPDNGLSPIRRQAIIWTNAGILVIRTLGTNFTEILIEIHTFSNKKMHLKISSGKCRPFCLGLNVLTFVNDTELLVSLREIWYRKKLHIRISFLDIGAKHRSRSKREFSAK